MVKQAVQENLQAVGLTRAPEDTYGLGGSPFCQSIREFPLPDRFAIPKFDAYDGVSDPLVHLRHFSQKMSVWGDSDPLNCRMFSSSLGATSLA